MSDNIETTSLPLVCQTVQIIEAREKMEKLHIQRTNPAEPKCNLHLLVSDFDTKKEEERMETEETAVEKEKEKDKEKKVRFQEEEKEEPEVEEDDSTDESGSTTTSSSSETSTESDSSNEGKKPDKLKDIIADLDSMGKFTIAKIRTFEAPCIYLLIRNDLEMQPRCIRNFRVCNEMFNNDQAAKNVTKVETRENEKPDEEAGGENGLAEGNVAADETEGDVGNIEEVISEVREQEKEWEKVKSESENEKRSFYVKERSKIRIKVFIETFIFTIAPLVAQLFR